MSPSLLLVAMFVSDPLANPANYGQPSAALYTDQILVNIRGHLYGGTHEFDQAAVKRPLHYYIAKAACRTSDQTKFEIRGERFLLFEAGGFLSIFSIDDLPLLEDSKYADKLCRRLGYEGRRDFYISRCNGAYSANLLFPPYRKYDVSVPIRMRGSAEPDPIDKYISTARYDVQLAGPKSVRLFHAYKDTLFVSIEFDYLNDWYRKVREEVEDGRVKPPDRQLRTGKLPADFTERFAVYTVGKRDYLMTDNGKVYLCVPKGKTEVEVSAVWSGSLSRRDHSRKIVGVVQDVDNDAVYGWGFVTTSSAPERFYVELWPKSVAVEYKRTVPLWNGHTDAYLESYECARAFRKAMEKQPHAK